MLNRFTIVSAIPLFILAAVLGADAVGQGRQARAQGAVEVLGDVFTCPSGQQVQGAFRLDAGAFRVVGPLASFDGMRAAVVDGPTGAVPATLAADAQAGAVRAGDLVEMRGALNDLGRFVASALAPACDAGAAATATATPAPVVEDVQDQPVGAQQVAQMQAQDECNRGPGTAGDMRIELKDGDVDVHRAPVQSFSGDTLIVVTPLGELTVIVAGEVRGDLSHAAEVRLEGRLNHDGTVMADEIRVLCPDEAHNAAPIAIAMTPTPAAEPEKVERHAEVEDEDEAEIEDEQEIEIEDEREDDHGDGHHGGDHGDNDDDGHHGGGHSGHN